MARAAGAAAVAAALVVGAALPAAAATDELVLEEVAPAAVYSVVGPLLELGGIVYFQGTSPSTPTGSWLFALDPATDAVAPVLATSGLGQVSGLASDGTRLFFLSPAGGENAVHVYDPATATTARYDWPVGEEAFPDRLAVAGGEVYVVFQSDGLIHAMPAADPATASGIAPVATSPLPDCADGATAPIGAADGLRVAGAFVYYSQSCADIGSDQLFRRADPSTAEAVVLPPPPAAADLGAPYGELVLGDRTLFAAGPIAGAQHLYSFASVDLSQPIADLGGSNPGVPVAFQGAAIWFMDDGGERRIFRSADGLTASAIGTAAGSGLEAELALVGWGDLLVLNGFPVISPSDPVGTRTNYLLDPASSSLTRLGPQGAIVPPFVAADGTAYVTAFAALGADADSQHLYRIVERSLPATGADALVSAGAAVVLIALGLVGVAVARRRA